MKQIKKHFLILIIITNQGFCQFHNNNFDFSALDIFWSIVDDLQNNTEPTAAKWNKLFSHPGYQILSRVEFSENFFKDKFRLVFAPGNKWKLDESLKKSHEAPYLKHYVKVLHNRQKLEQQVNRLKSANLNQQLTHIVMNYLPMNSVSEYPPVSFLIFANDGRGYDPIIVDLYASIDWDYKSFLAHEYHHWYRNKYYAINFNRIKSSDRALFEILSLLEAEGVADQIDKSSWVKNGGSDNREKNYVSMVSNSPAVINEMNILLEELAENKSNIQSTGLKLKNIVPQGGHPTGFYMADIILQKLGRAELIKTVGNPFAFVRQYNNAARMKGSKIVFSHKAMKVIDELERNYILQ